MSGCACHSPLRNCTPAARRRFSSSARWASASETGLSSSGYQRSARSQRRWLPTRPTTASSPRRCRISSMIPTSRAPNHGCFRLSDRAVLQLAAEQRTARIELAEYIAAKAGVRLQERSRASFLLGAPRPAPARPHPCAQQRQVFDGPDERVPVDELALLPEQAVDLRRVVGAEAAPEDELLRRCDGRDRVDLEKADSADRVEDRAGRPVEQLRSDGDSACLLETDDPRADPERLEARRVRAARLWGLLRLALRGATDAIDAGHSLLLRLTLVVRAADAADAGHLRFLSPSASLCGRCG